MMWIHATGLFLTYHWHLHQPIYWPAPRPSDGAVQTAYDSYVIKRGGGGYYPGSDAAHPENRLGEGDSGAYEPIFSKEDRVRIYQERGYDALKSLAQTPLGGAQISYSGSLMQNIKALGQNNLWGYSPSWSEGYRASVQMKTANGVPRADLVGFSYHHGLLPLLPESMVDKEIKLHKRALKLNFNSESKGFFPSEIAFDERLIKIFQKNGIEWTFVAANHVARAMEGYLDRFQEPGTSTWNTTPPNRADMRNSMSTVQNWWSGSIDGRGASLPVPTAYLPHYVRSIDPETGDVYRMKVIPADDTLSYMDGYGPLDLGLVDRNIAPYQGSRPLLIALAHDGDNAWGGGYSYYNEAVPSLIQQAQAKGYGMTNVEAYLKQYPVPEGDVIHVESGGWVNPDRDFGSPQFLQWIQPPFRSVLDPEYDQNKPQTYIDFKQGFSASSRTYAAILAGAHLCEEIEARELRNKPLNLDNIVTGQNMSVAERCWHFVLAGVDSGFTYYGTSLDDEVKSSLALHSVSKGVIEALEKEEDSHPPTMMPLQRWPHNPGGKDWGPLTRYKPIGFRGAPSHNPAFFVWTLAYDRSSLSRATLFYRESLDQRTYPSDENKLYRKGSSVGPWIPLEMEKRDYAPDERGRPPWNDVQYFIPSPHLATLLYQQIPGSKGRLMDYYVETKDSKGLTTRSEIRSVYVE